MTVPRSPSAAARRRAHLSLIAPPLSPARPPIDWMKAVVWLGLVAFVGITFAGWFLFFVALFTGRFA